MFQKQKYVRDTEGEVKEEVKMRARGYTWCESVCEMAHGRKRIEEGKKEDLEKKVAGEEEEEEEEEEEDARVVE